MCFTTCCDAPDVFRVKLVRARKPHLCCECNRPIQPGQRYESVFGVWDGRADTYATCLLCYDLRGVVKARELEAGCDRSDATPPLTDLLHALRYGDDDGETEHYPAVPEVLC